MGKAACFSRADLEFQRLTREALECILEDNIDDYHLTAMRNNRSYRRFYMGIHRATDMTAIGELMTHAYEARQNDNLSVKRELSVGECGFSR